MDEFPLFDMNLGLRYAIYRSILFVIIRNFLSDAKQGGIFAMNQAYDNRDWKAVASIVCQILEQSHHMGTIRMTHACKYFLQHYNDGQKKFLYQLYPQLLAVIKETIAEISALSDNYGI